NLSPLLPGDSESGGGNRNRGARDSFSRVPTATATRKARLQEWLRNRHSDHLVTIGMAWFLARMEPEMLPFLLQISIVLTEDPSGEFAFMRHGKVCAVDLARGTERPLSPELRFKADRPLAWSPDGSALLYWSHGEIGWEIWAMDADGSHRRNLTPTRAGG